MLINVDSESSFWSDDWEADIEKIESAVAEKPISLLLEREHGAFLHVLATKGFTEESMAIERDAHTALIIYIAEDDFYDFINARGDRFKLGQYTAEFVSMGC